MSDIRVKKYFENIPYGKDSRSSEIHGKRNHALINQFVASLVRNYDSAMAEGNKQAAQVFRSGVNQIAKDLDNLKSIKEEFAMNYGGGVGGKNLFSNYTDLNWDREFFTENGRINFDKNMKPVLIVDHPEYGEIPKSVEDITERWHLKGTFENTFMKMQQDAVKQRNAVGQPLDFDIDHAVANLLENEDGWKTAVSDKIGGRYFLNDWMIENQEGLKSGNIPDDKMHPDSFNPEMDGRLHDYFANRLRKSFDPNYQTPAEARRADELIARADVAKAATAAVMQETNKEEQTNTES